MSPLEEETLKYPILKIFSVCYYSAPLPRQKQFKRINTVGTKRKEKKREKKVGHFLCLLFPFGLLLLHPPPVFLHIISLTSLPLTLLSSFCSSFQSFFQENITPSMVIHHQKKKKKNPKSQYNEENQSSALRGMTLPWHCAFLWQQIHVPVVPVHLPSPTARGRVQAVWEPFLGPVQTNCNHSAGPSHPRTHRAEMQMPFKC